MTYRCHYCDGELDELGYRCQKCKRFCCSAHRLPESHECNGLYIMQEVEKSKTSKNKKNKLQKVLTPVEELYEIEMRLRGNPDNAILLLKKAQLLNIIRKPGKSAKTYQKYLEIENENAEAWFEMGIQLEKLNKKKFAVNAFRNAVDLDPNNVIYKNKFQKAKKLQMERALGITINQLKPRPPIIEPPEEIFEKDIEVDTQNIPEKLKDEILRTQEHKDAIIKKIGNKLVIRQQLDLIEKIFEFKEDSDHFGVIYVKIAPHFGVKVNLDRYPIKPVIELPVEINLHIGDPAVILRTLRTWNVYDETPVLTALNELRACIGFWDYAPVLISERFIRAAFNNAETHSPNEMMGFMRLDRWIIWGLESPRRYMSTPVSVRVPIDDIPTDDSVIGMIHSHPIGNAVPSMPDRESFKRFHRNIIISVADKAMRLFDRHGRELKYEIVNIEDFDNGIKSNLTLFNIIGLGKFSQREDRDHKMFS